MKTRPGRPTLILTLILLVAALPAAAQTVRTVPGAFPTIQSAIDASGPGDIVLVSPGTYLEAIDFAGKEITVRGAAGPDQTVIDGEGRSTVVTFRSGEGRGSVLDGFTIQNGRGAPALGSSGVATAGGITCSGASPTIIRCIVRMNRGGDADLGAFAGAGGIGLVGPGPQPGAAILSCTIEDNLGGTAFSGGACEGEDGASCEDRRAEPGAGGIHALESTPFIRACVIRYNRGGDGYDAALAGGAGAIEYTLPPGTPVVEDCEILDNTGGDAYGETAVAGAGGVHGSSPLLRFCRIAGNTGGTATGAAGTGGGAGGVFGDAPVIVSCGIFDNLGGDAAGAAGLGGGGGVYVTGNAVITGTVIARNRGGTDDVPPGLGGGGGLHVLGGQVNLDGVTIADNRGAEGAEGSGSGGVHVAGGGVAISSCILWSNTGGSPKILPSADEIGGAGATAVSHADVLGGFPGAGNIDADPAFLDQPGGDYALRAGSPCIDTGDSSGIAALDFDGDPRPIGGAMDMGADEYNAAIYPGSGEDLKIATFVNGRGAPRAAVKSLTVGDVLTVALFSRVGDFAANPMILLGQVFTTGLPPVSPALFPELHVNSGGFVLAPGPIPFAERPRPNGRAWLFGVPTAMAGQSLMIQGLALSVGAANGSFAASEGHEMRLMP